MSKSQCPNHESNILGELNGIQHIDVHSLKQCWKLMKVDYIQEPLDTL